MEAINVEPGPEAPVAKRKPGRPKGSGPKIEAGTAEVSSLPIERPSAEVVRAPCGFTPTVALVPTD